MPHAVRDVALILLAGSVTMLPRLDAGDLHLDGVLYAEVAHGLAERGAWLDLTIGSDPYWRKPPLVFWLMRGAYWIGGVSEASARAPSLLAGIFCGVALYFLVARLWDVAAGQEVLHDLPGLAVVRQRPLQLTWSWPGHVTVPWAPVPATAGAVGV